MSKGNARLPTVGAAPEFALTNQAGERMALKDLRGKVLAVTFIYATCKDTCPVLTAKMAMIQRKMGADFGPRVRFVSITVEPEVTDTPAVLKSYAQGPRRGPGGLELSDGLRRRDQGRRAGVTACTRSG